MSVLPSGDLHGLLGSGAVISVSTRQDKEYYNITIPTGGLCLNKLYP
jgi:hypothetical protein